MYFYKKILILFFVFSLLAINHANSQTESTIQNDSMKHFVLKEFVVTGQYKEQSIDKSTMNIKVISKIDIQKMGAQQLNDVLEKELNIQISQDNILGSGMSMQGISGQNVKILIDGIPITGRLNGNIDLSQINIQQIQRIEVIEGPMSVSYGTDALAGTINIITQKKLNKNYAVNIGSYYESIGRYNLNLATHFKLKNVTFKLTGMRIFFDGWNEDDHNFKIEKKNYADSSRFKSWKPKLQYGASADIFYDLKNTTFGLHSDYFNEEILNRGYPRAPYNESAFDDNYYTYRTNHNLNFNSSIIPKHQLSGFVDYSYFKRIKNTYIKDLTTLDQVLTENIGDQDTTFFKNIMSRASIKSSNKELINYEIGYDAVYETTYGNRIGNNKKQQFDIALFGSAELKPLSNLIIRPGLRVIHNTIYKAPVIPSIHLKYELYKNEDETTSLNFRFSYGRGFRAPSLKEMYFYFVDINHDIEGNPNLKAERSHSVNSNLILKKDYNQLSLNLDAGIFYNYINDMITLSRLNTSAYSYFNLQHYITKGLQLTSNISSKELNITLGGGIIGRYNLLADSMKNITRFSYSPEVKSTISYLLEKPKTTISFYYRYVGKLPIFIMDENNQPIIGANDDYHLLDASTSKPFFSKKILLTIGCKNMFNIKNIDGVMLGGAHSSAGNSIPLATGRSYFINMQFNFNSTL